MAEKKKIVMGGNYESKGRPARILAVDIKGTARPVIAAVLVNGGELILDFDEYGCYGGTGGKNAPTTDIDLILSFRDFKIDEPVMVRMMNNDRWVKRHFAGVNAAGNPIVFCDGCTSWSTINTIVPYECRKPTAEELTGFNL